MHRWNRLKLLYTFGELESEGGSRLVACEGRTRGEKGGGWKYGEATFLLVKSDSQWKIRNVKILILRDL